MYSIPNDTGGNWRLNDFIKYALNGINDTCAPMKYWLDSINASKDDIIWATLLYSATYCLGTTMFMYSKLDYKTLTKQELNDFWVEYKSKLIFQSDRVYVKSLNWFVPIISSFLSRTKRCPSKYFNDLLKGSPEQIFSNMYDEVNRWQYYGRFSAILFLRTLIQTLDVPMDFIEEYNWAQGATTTAGALVLGYKDDKIPEFLKTGKVSPRMRGWLDNMLIRIKTELYAQAPEREISMLYLTSDLCSYFKLYKGSRYYGYYVDRAQKEILTLEKNLPEAQDIWDLLWKARKAVIPNKVLGELNGWTGIQNKKFKLFLERGVWFG